VPHKDRDLWTCPKCGEKFVTRNMAHSCGKFTIEGLFAKSDPNVLATYRRLERMAKSVAPFHVIPQKTRVSFQLRTRCAGGYPMKSAFRFAFLSRKVIEHPRIFKVETFAPDQHVHYVMLRSPDEVDGQIKEWLKISTAYGEQRH
jgi:hypothetical protein